MIYYNCILVYACSHNSIHYTFSERLSAHCTCFSSRLTRTLDVDASVGQDDALVNWGTSLDSSSDIVLSACVLFVGYTKWHYWENWISYNCVFILSTNKRPQEEYTMTMNYDLRYWYCSDKSLFLRLIFIFSRFLSHSIYPLLSITLYFL